MNKKLLALSLAVFVACGVAGCGGGDKKPAKPADPPKQAANVKKDDYSRDKYWSFCGSPYHFFDFSMVFSVRYCFGKNDKNNQ